MKYIITFLLAFTTFFTFGQATILRYPSDDEPKPQINFIVIWREAHSASLYSISYGYGQPYTPEPRWETHATPFESEKEMLKWLNTNQSWYVDENRRRSNLDENTFIAAYDLRDAKPLKLQFKTEKKSKPREVVIEAEEWEDTFWEIKN